MRNASPEKRVAAGGAIAGIGGAAVISYFVYAASGSNRDFWTMPGIISVVVLVLGLLLLISGLFGRDRSEPPRQVQRGGDHSAHLQAGRDITIGEDERRQR